MTTIPVKYPCKCAASRIVPHGVYEWSTPIARLCVLRPHENAVAPAAESVITEFEERVREEPTR